MPAPRPVSAPDCPPLLAETIRHASAARDSVTAALEGLVPSVLLEDVRLITSELSSNALRHGTPPSTIELWLTPRSVVV